MAISAREADIRRDQELDRAVWFHYQPKGTLRRCCICGEDFFDGIDLDGDIICKGCHEEQMRLVSRYLNPAYAERFEELVDEISTKIRG